MNVTKRERAVGRAQLYCCGVRARHYIHSGYVPRTLSEYSRLPPLPAAWARSSRVGIWVALVFPYEPLLVLAPRPFTSYSCTREFFPYTSLC
jgi:hypothetical protein